MRNIKFRGKRKDNNEWVYGYYFCHKGQSNSHFIITENGFIFSVIKETVSMFTDSVDELNKEIYEKDIVSFIGKFVTGSISKKIIEKQLEGIVKWNKKGFWEIKVLNDNYVKSVSFIAVKSFVRVLGNLYENTDLLSENPHKY